MNRKMLKRKVTWVFIVLVLIVCRAFYVFVFGRSGVAVNVAGLSKAYSSAGTSCAAFYTNSFLQRMPFVGPISWRNNSIRPVVLLTGRVDVVAFKQRMATEPFTDLIESRLEGKPVAISTIHHRAGPWVVQSHGVLNLVSGDFSMTTGELERMLDEAEWRHLTNSGFKEFDFGTRN